MWHQEWNFLCKAIKDYNWLKGKENGNKGGCWPWITVFKFKSSENALS